MKLWMPLCTHVRSNLRASGLVSRKSVLASTSKVCESYPDAQNHVGRMEEIRKCAFVSPKIIMCNPKPQ